MRLFLSYAGEHRRTADAITLRLREAGHVVFFDKDDLPAGESYDDRIRGALTDSDGFVFLVSPESVEPGAYTLTEMELARERWPSPSGHVLPVMVSPTPYGAIPEYLKAVTVLEPQGNVVADTAAAVERLARPRRFRPWAWAAVAAVLVAAAVVAWWAWRRAGPARTGHARAAVTDLTTEAPVAGATVEIRCGVSTLASAVTDDAGKVGLDFVPCRDRATVAVKHEQYTEQSRSLPVDGSELALGLLPKALGGCVLRNGEGVVVGHFRPPVTASDPGGELAGRIAEALTYDVLTVLQTLNLPPALQPRFVACDEARPRSVDFAASYARALGADAFLLGSVEPVSNGFDVRAFVGDAFQLFKPPLPSVNTGVALDDPAAARLEPEMHGAILTAIARGYAERQKFAECVDVAMAAKRLTTRVSTALEQTLARCQAGTGVASLRGGA
jgi:hypothetical protein